MNLNINWCDANGITTALIIASHSFYCGMGNYCQVHVAFDLG